MPKKMQNRPDLLANAAEKREAEAKNKNLHMKYEKPDNLWKEF